MNFFHTAGTLIIAGVHLFLQICATIFHGVTGICHGQAVLPLERIGFWISPEQAVSLLRAALRLLTQ